MSDMLLLLTGAILVNHFALTQFSGARAFVGGPGRPGAAIVMAAATSLIITVTSIANALLYFYLLLPLELLFLRTLVQVLVIAVAVSAIAIVLQKTDPLRYQMSGIFMLLLCGNCVLISVALNSADESATFVDFVFPAIAAALVFSVMLVQFAAMRERLQMSEVPEPFQGAGIALITAGLISLAFMGFAGLV